MKQITKLLSVMMVLILMMTTVTAFGEDASQAGKELKILFTHDIHSFFTKAKQNDGDSVREHGGAARLKTLLDENRDENTIYVDAGDFSMGTLLQAGFSTDAYELRLLGRLGCTVTTFGNHEFDQGGTGAAKMLQAAMASGDPLPLLLQPGLDFTGTLTEEQQCMRDALDAYSARENTVLDVNGLKVGLFAVMGYDSISCAPTSGMIFTDYIKQAQKAVRELKQAGAEIIVCISHSGTSGDGKNGEDIDLANQAKGIDVIISGHSHSTYAEPCRAGNTLIVSAGEYLTNLGSLTLQVQDGKVSCMDYRLIPCDETVTEDPEIAATVAEYQQKIRETYLAEENVDFDQVICHSDFSFMPLNEMYARHEEYPMGNLIADACLYEARRNGIDDIDVVLVSLGTIRGSFPAGDITVADAFEICSLGVGADGSTGHPLVAGWLTGSELKLLIQLESSLGPLVSSVKMSYGGLRYTFNTNRMLLDQAYDIRLTRPDGTLEELQDDRLYKVVCNMYAANMLGMLSDMSGGLVSIVAKYADGTPVKDLYTCSLLNTEGKEIKEWVAFKNYLSSFPEKNGVPTIPERYAAPEGRKLKLSAFDGTILYQPGVPTLVVLGLILALIVLVVVLIATRKKRKERRLKRRAERDALKKAMAEKKAAKAEK